MTELLNFGTLVALTVGLTEVVKRGFKLNTRFVPLVSLATGVILTLAGSLSDITSLTVITGIAIGLSASGLFDQKAILGK
jgi:hypothetical protein